MKKYIILTLTMIALSNCEIKPRNANASSFGSVYSYREEKHNGMTYGVWYVMQQSSQTGYATSVVNLTKDQLEVELLRQQLAEIANRQFKQKNP
jgi:ABC-type phosphate transport system auxiliary subunit